MKKLFWVNLFFILLLSCITEYDNSDLSVEYYNLGNSFLGLGEFDKAKSYYEKALVIDPELHKARFNLIEVYMLKKEYSKAREGIRHLEVRSEINIKVSKMSAYLYYLEGELSEALALYLDVFKKGDISVDVQLSILKLSYLLERYDASEFYITNLSEDSEFINGKNNDLLIDFFYISGMIYEKLENEDKVLSSFRECYELGKKDLYLVNKLLDIYTDREDVEKKKELLNTLVEVDEGNKGMHLFDLSLISLIDDNNYTEGYLLLEEAIGNGFSDKSLALELLKKPNLIGVDKIRQLFVENNIIE